MKIFHRLIAAVAAGYILMFFSERMFWSRLTPQDTLPQLLLMLGVYSLMAYAFLWLIDYSRARVWMTVFLCGAAFGWLNEGLIHQTLLQSFPASLSWTGLAWHALVSALFGWYGLRRAYLQGRWQPVALLSAGMGIAWGIWALRWRSELGAPIPLADFAVHTWAASLLLVGAYSLYERYQPEVFHPTRLEALAVGLFFAAWLGIVALPALQWGIFLLLALLALTGFALWRVRQATPYASMLAVLRGRLSSRTALALLALPLAATLVYAVAWAVSFFPATRALIHGITAPVGLVLYGLSFAWAVRSRF